ncbi:MAG: dihydroorotate dehydrogenase electron transfer subunit [Treponema sp.]|jgi:NAD(P)H-flavin reductase|nr:dihydroorotate dehydrogenase electron transfer subunit [Treponema sp.]
MSVFPAASVLKGCRLCRLLKNTAVTGEFFSLDFAWPSAPEHGGVPEPKAGQFFLVRPKRGSGFLGRPLSMAYREKDAGLIRFLIAPRGRGTEELSQMREGEEAELTGPLGNAWGGFLPPEARRVALIGGGIGVAPLLAFAQELFAPPEGSPASPGFDFYAGFRTAFRDDEERRRLLGSLRGKNLVIAAEDGGEGKKGRIPDFLEPAGYDAVFACGPEPMLRAAALRCETPARIGGVPCFVSLERHMACGVGACLGCTVRSAGGNRRCCADGPIFPAAEVFLDR